MNTALIELLVGLYLLGTSIKVTKTLPNREYTKQIDLFRFVFALILIVLALAQGVRVI